MAYNFDVPILIKHQILWLHISMHNFHFLQKGKCFDQLSSVQFDNFDIEFLPLLYQVCQIPAAAVFEDEIQICRILTQIDL